MAINSPYIKDAREVMTLLANNSPQLQLAVEYGSVVDKDALYAEIERHSDAAKATGNNIMRDGLALLRVWLERNIATSPKVAFGYLPWYVEPDNA